MGARYFSYGFIRPTIDTTVTPPLVDADARAAAAVISGRSPTDGDAYALDSQTYPGESGAPVFRQHDHVLVGVVRGTHRVPVPPPLNWTRGPTVAAPLAPLAVPIAARGIAAVP